MIKGVDADDRIVISDRAVSRARRSTPCANHTLYGAASATEQARYLCANSSIGIAYG